jgi:hypothetical protein
VCDKWAHDLALLGCTFGVIGVFVLLVNCNGRYLPTLHRTDGPKQRLFLGGLRMYVESQVSGSVVFSRCDAMAIIVDLCRNVFPLSLFCCRHPVSP